MGEEPRLRGRVGVAREAVPTFAARRSLLSAPLPDRFLSVSQTPAASAIRAFRHRGLTRALAAVWLLVHGLIVGAVPVLDARLESGATVVAHWEDDSRSTCPPTHDTSACRVCQLLGNGEHDVVARVAIAPAVGVASESPGRQDVRRDGARLLGARSTRGPPIV